MNFNQNLPTQQTIFKNNPIEKFPNKIVIDPYKINSSNSKGKTYIKELLIQWKIIILSF